MKIVIEVHGDKVTAIRSEETTSNMPANVGDVVPSPPPPALLERARKLGAMSAGAAQLGIGAVLKSTEAITTMINSPEKVRGKKTVKKSARKSR